MSKFSERLGDGTQYSVKESVKAVLDEDSYNDFIKALGNIRVTIPAIVNTLDSFGVKVSESTMRRWRKEVMRNV